ncbi:hypothetical protein BCR33DRAFT_781479 [Rhizoclosmatium globosum]|uniref:ABC transporter domain-containing protein n=1 Tax=Rhizoclosmatium globosum TaxID=329046 RepID=A0A1Y2CSX5_9FUNG|nr:hypothetical protein BCR33DRAFT_781479 [Rhizoclosmatium globosum]|eukprot:ORY49964.1 hypothetical protein BCR33DRAFT_781479 [Rhizoclosmatium globosum]
MSSISPLSLESFAAQYNITLPKKFPNPFNSEGRRARGKPWTLGKLPVAVPKELGAGFGCFQAPYVPVGFTLDITDNGTLPLTIENACKPGFFCPFLDINNPATYPVQCPPSGNCFYFRSIGFPCWEPQGVFEPMICPSGFYCPDYKTVTVCPPGHYCLTGQTAPTKCEFLSLCSAGTIIQQHYGFTIIVAIIDIILVVIYRVLRQREKQRIMKVEEDQENKKALTTEDIQRNISALTAGFHKGLDGRVSGSINAGKMTAIMGPSGAGKTTFMNVLMGKAARSAGTLKINGTVAELASFKKLIGYVPQDDTMIEELSVRENIRYSARVRLPNSWTNTEVEAHAEAILQALNLSHVADKRIGNVLERGISGGQRKRVNIGMELAAAPLSVFLDEPTSGLDSTAAMDAVNILHSISRLGLTIVAVVHQPRVEIFETFDDVLMIAPGGRTAYFGPVSGAKPYFESLGFYFGQPPIVTEITKKWKTYAKTLTTADGKVSNASIDSMNTLAKHRGASFIRQVGLSHNRYLAQQSRLVGGFVLECLNGLAAGAIMGVASFGGENLSAHLIAPYLGLSTASRAWFIAMYGMLVGIAISLAAAPAGVNVFSGEKAVYLREAEAGHSSTAYFIGKNISSIPRILFSSAHFFALYYLLAQPPIAIGIQFALLFLNFFGIYGMGMFISMFISQQNAPLIAVTIGLISEVLCGFGPSLANATADGYVFILNIGLNRWAAEAQFWEWAKPYDSVFDEYLLSYSFGYQKGNTVKNMIIMFALGLAYRLIAKYYVPA